MLSNLIANYWSNLNSLDGKQHLLLSAITSLTVMLGLVGYDVGLIESNCDLVPANTRSYPKVASSILALDRLLSSSHFCFCFCNFHPALELAWLFPVFL